MQIHSNYLLSSLFIDSTAEQGKTVWNKLAWDKRTYIIASVCWLILTAIAFAVYRHCFHRKKEQSLKNKTIDIIPAHIPLKDSDSTQKGSSENTTTQKIIKLQTNETTAPDPTITERLIEEIPTPPSADDAITQFTETAPKKDVSTDTTQSVLEETPLNDVLDEAPIENSPIPIIPNIVEEEKLRDTDLLRIILQGIEPKNNEMSLQELQELATKFEDYKKDANQQQGLGNTNPEHVYINDDFGPFEQKSHKLEIFVRYLVLNNIIHAYDRRYNHLCLYLSPKAPLHYSPDVPFQEHSKRIYFDRNRLLEIDASMEEKALSIPSIDQYPENAQKSMRKIFSAIRAIHWNILTSGIQTKILLHPKRNKKSLNTLTDPLFLPIMKHHEKKAILAKKHHWYKLRQNHKSVAEAFIDDSLSGDKINPYLDDLVERGVIHSWERRSDSLIDLLVQTNQPHSTTMRDKAVITKEKEFKVNNWLDREKILALFLQPDGSGLGEEESKSLNDLLNKANSRLQHGPIKCYYRWDKDFKKALDKLVDEGIIYSYKIGKGMLPGNISPLKVFIKAADCHIKNNTDDHNLVNQ